MSARVPFLRSFLLVVGPLAVGCGRSAGGWEDLPGDEGPEIRAWYLDRDGDGFGSDAFPLLSTGPERCEELYGAACVPRAGDCDDDDPDVCPGAAEWCNDRDDDCDGEVDGAASVDGVDCHEDQDADGFGEPTVLGWDCQCPVGSVPRGGTVTTRTPA